MVDIGIALDIIQKSGSWFSYNGERLCQGKENVRKLIEENKEMFDEIDAKIRSMSEQLELVDDEFDLDDGDDGDDFDIRTLGGDDDN